MSNPWYSETTIDPDKIRLAKSDAVASYLRYQDLAQDEYTDTMTLVVAADNAITYMDEYINVLTDMIANIGAAVTAYMAATSERDDEELF